MSKEPITLAQLHEYVEKLDGLEPIFEFEQPRKENGSAVNESLARAFSDEHFRNHLKNTINKQIYHAAVHCDGEKQMWMNAGRITVLKELYRDMETSYYRIPKNKK